MLSRKNYKAIADIIKNRMESDEQYKMEWWGYIICSSIMYDLADYFKKDNPNFDEEKFINACLGEEK